MSRRVPFALVLSLMFVAPLTLRAEDQFFDSNGVKIHYVTMGKGPLVVMIHGFPDFSYTWRDQMPALAKHFQVVAVDLRGYNKSDQPEGVAPQNVQVRGVQGQAFSKPAGKDGTGQGGTFLTWVEKNSNLRIGLGGELTLDAALKIAESLK